MGVPGDRGGGRAEGLRSTNWQLKNSHGDVQGRQTRCAVKRTRNTEFILTLLIIILFSTWTTVNLLLLASVKCSIGNRVSNIVITVYGAGWVQGLLEDPFVRYINI